MSRQEFETPEIFSESLDRFVSSNEGIRNSSGLFLDAGLLLFEYGEEKDKVEFSKDVSLDINPPAIVRLLFQREDPSFVVVIAFESESLNRFVKLGDGKPKIGDGKYTKEVDQGKPKKRNKNRNNDDKSLIREATWSELGDFRRLFDIVKGQIVDNDYSFRDPGSGLDRLWESILEEKGIPIQTP